MDALFAIVVVMVIIYYLNKTPKPTQEQIKQKQVMSKEMICPHCHHKGTVATQQVTRKSGIHGGKAVAAVFTCGISMLGTGLSRKNQITEASCSNCGATWSF